VQNCPPLQALDEPLLALLVWRAREQDARAGQRIYAEGTPCDNTFGLLVEGELNISQRGKSIRILAEPALFGEIGFFEARNTRTATVEVSSPSATYLLFEIDSADLKSGPLKPLGDWLSSQAWTTVVEDANRDR
jgi:hypothetical protein